MLKFIGLDNLYKKLMHTGDVGSYPLLERALAYAVPTLGTLAYVAFAPHDQVGEDQAKVDYSPFMRSCSYWGLPAGLAFYAGSQYGVELLKDVASSTKSSIGKQALDMTITVLDKINNVIPYTIAYNMLPIEHSINEVAAFRVMPEMVNAIESDLKAWKNNTPYEGEVAGRIWIAGAAGLGAAKLASFTSGKLFKEPVVQADQAQTDQGQAHYNHYNIQAYAEEHGHYTNSKQITSALVESFIFGLTKKWFLGTSYEKDEIAQDILKGFLKDAWKASVPGESLAFDKLKDTVFEGIPLFITAELAPSILNAASEGVAMIDFENLDFMTDTTVEL